jgi:hypothetical protein
MEIPKEIILDLLPVYLSGEARPATRTLVEEFATHDADVATAIRARGLDVLPRNTSSMLNPENELRSLRRTRTILGWQRWLLGLAIFFTAMSLSNSFTIQGGRLREFHLLLSDYPIEFGACVVLGIACWTGYFYIRRSLRTARS